MKISGPAAAHIVEHLAETVDAVSHNFIHASIMNKSRETAFLNVVGCLKKHIA